MEYKEDDFEEEGESTFAYIFMPRPATQGVFADRFTDVTGMLGQDAEDFKNLMALYRQMGMEEENVRHMESLPAAVVSMLIRCQFRCDGAPGICLVKTTEPIDGELMDKILTKKQRDGTLDQFIRQSRIF